MKAIGRILPGAFLLLFSIEVIAVLLPKHDRGLHVSDFGSLPVLMNGRVQPFDSVGHNALLQIRSTSDVPLEEVPSWQFWKHAKKLNATEWLLEVLTNPERSNRRPVFLIHNPELLRTLELGEQGIEKSALRYYTYEQVQPHSGQIDDLAAQFEKVEENLRTPYQLQLLKLKNALVLYRGLQLSLQPPGVKNLARLLDDFERTATAGAAALRARDAGQDYDHRALSLFTDAANPFINIANSGRLLAIPPRDPSSSPDQWVNFGAGVLGSLKAGAMHPAARSLALIATAYCQSDEIAFNQGVANYRQWLLDFFPDAIRKSGAEFYFNNVQVFLHAMIIYLTAFLLAVCTLLAITIAPNLAESLRRSSVWLLGLALAVHTFGLVFRMILEGRPPVHNLYSSALFIGWGAVLLGLVMERLFKVGIGCAVASISGFGTLIIAHNLAFGGDTMEMLRAVLDTNFWLATHVTAVTLGYASTFVAGLLGIAYICLGLFTPILNRKLRTRESVENAESAIKRNRRIGAKPSQVQSSHSGEMKVGKALSKMIYGTVCFATLFSFVGTVLGGIWADQSWGRFWGWDPKENGALIIVLWNALILHARWGDMVFERGIAVMSVFGNVVTSFSWFGVNMLGIGLHSYGFMDAAFRWLMIFVVSQMVFIGMGIIPLRYWCASRARLRAGSLVGNASTLLQGGAAGAQTIHRKERAFPSRPVPEAK